jgi:hypothetical protein
MTSKRQIGVCSGEGGVSQSPPCLLLVTWELYMTPSHTVLPGYRAARVIQRYISLNSPLYNIAASQM